MNGQVEINSNSQKVRRPNIRVKQRNDLWSKITARNSRIKEIFRFEKEDVSEATATRDSVTGSMIRNAFLLSFDAVTYAALVAAEGVARVVVAGGGGRDDRIPMTVEQQIETAGGLKMPMMEKGLREKLYDAVHKGGAVAYDACAGFVDTMHGRNDRDSRGGVHGKFLRRMARELNALGYDVKTLVRLTVESEPVQKAADATRQFMQGMKEKGMSFFNRRNGARAAGALVLAAALCAGVLGAPGAEAVTAVSREAFDASVLSAASPGPDLVRMIDEKMPKGRDEVFASGLPLRIEAVTKPMSRNDDTLYATLEPRIDTGKIYSFGHLEAPEVPEYLREFLRIGVPLTLNEQNLHTLDRSLMPEEDFAKLSIPGGLREKILNGGRFELRTEPVFGNSGKVERLEYVLCDVSDPHPSLSPERMAALELFLAEPADRGSSVNDRVPDVMKKAREREEESLYSNVLRMVQEIPLEETEKVLGEGIASSSAEFTKNLLYCDLIEKTEENEKALGSNLNEILTLGAKVLAFEGDRAAVAALALMAAEDGKEREEALRVISMQGIRPEEAISALGSHPLVCRAIESAGGRVEDILDDRGPGFDL